MLAGGGHIDMVIACGTGRNEARPLSSQDRQHFGIDHIVNENAYGLASFGKQCVLGSQPVVEKTKFVPG